MGPAKELVDLGLNGGLDQQTRAQPGHILGDLGQPSAFTSSLVSGLETGEADLDRNGEISVDELYDYVYRKVRETTPGEAPMKWSLGSRETW